MKSVPIPSDLFARNRRRLAAMLEPNSIAVVNANDVLPTNADGVMGFHQNSDLFYLSGINQEESILVLAPDSSDEKLRELLFLRQPDPQLELWEGHKLTKAEARAISAIPQIHWLGEFPSIFHRLMCEAEHVYLNSNEHPRAVIEVETRDMRFIQRCQARYPLHDYRRLTRLMHELRAVKSAEEIEVIRHACRITRQGFLRVLRFVRPGVNEAEIEAEWAHEFVRNKATFAYGPIIAAGANNCVLHYTQNDQTCEAGQLLLMDVAAGYGQYMSDLTRTIPVSGRFTDRQKQVYEAVLRVFRQVSAAMRPGRTVRELREMTEKLIEGELLGLGLIDAEKLQQQDPDQPLVREYFMHGVAHPLGLDVHDVGFVQRPIQPGWVLTCEPGIYVRNEGFGIRLENDFLVTEGDPVDLMEDIPIEPDDIESWMAG